MRTIWKAGIIVAVILVIVAIEISRNRPDVAIAPKETNNDNISFDNNNPRIAQKTEQYPVAPEFISPNGYINTDGKNITLAEFRGKNVVLVDFWTFSCINCQRTLPHLTAWDEKYRDDGLVIVGVHTPEFGFEKEYANVLTAVQKYQIQYPVIQDNDFQTWRAYKNRYWPRKYLIDVDGFIVYDHIGEGGYEETEQKIQELLTERAAVLGLGQMDMQGLASANVTADVPTEIKTPEIYFGYGFARGHLGNPQGWIPDQTVQYTYPADILPNKFYLQGAWTNNNDGMKLESETGGIVLFYSAKIINIVAGSEEPTELEVWVDGEKKNTLTIEEHDLYEVYETETPSAHVIELRAKKGLEAFTFTFG